MPVNAVTLQIAGDLRNELAAVTDRQTRDIVAAWARAWDEVAGDLDAALIDLTTAAAGGRVTRAQLLRSERLAAALTVIRDRLADLAEQAGVTITGDLDPLVTRAVDLQAQMTASQLPGSPMVGASFARVDPEAIAAIVQRSTEQVTALTRPLSADATAAMRRELMRGVAVGANPRETARRMVARAGRQFNGGAGRALTIARTETLDAMRAGVMASDRANADILAGWTWVAALTTRTCPACFAMHGTVHDITEPGPLGHQNCRCARVPKTKTWADLGFQDIDEPADLTPDADRVFRDLPTADQRAILGPAGYRAWREGRFPREDWATRRSTSGWRDSYVPASPPRPSSSARLAS